jgi:hypothetical protein
MGMIFNIHERNYHQISKGYEAGQQMRDKEGEPKGDERDELMEELGVLAGRLNIDVEW